MVKSFKTGDLKIIDLMNADSSATRREMFGKVVGKDNAKELNALFETKMQSQKLGDAMEQFVNESAGLSVGQRRNLEQIVEDLRTKDLLTPDDLKSYKEDFISQKLGVGVSMEEAGNINKLSEGISKQTDIFKASPNEANQIKLGEAMLDLEDYIYKLAPEKQSAVQKVVNYLNFSKAAMASFDLSAPGRQGWGFISRKEWWKSWGKMIEGLDKNAARKIEARMIADPDYNRAVQDGLQLSKMGREAKYKEDTLASDVLQDLIPGMAESQAAYTIFLNNVRFTSYKRVLAQAAAAGEDIRPGSKASKDIASVINSFSGAGQIKVKGQDIMADPISQTVIWSPKRLMSTVQMFNPVRMAKLSPTARKEHIRNLAGMVGTTVTLLGLADAMGAEAELDPRSSDFGKVKVGDTRYDLSGGNASFITLVARVLTNSTKSSTSGTVRTLGEKYGDDSSLDVAFRYGRNKFAPLASFFADWMAGENTVGEKFSLEMDTTNAVFQRFFPMIMSVLIESYYEYPEQMLPVAMSNLFGLGTMTYTDKKEDSGSVKDLFK